MIYVLLSLIMTVFLVCVGIKAQQIPDTGFKPPIKQPVYQLNKGPVILIDEGHFNLHTAGGRFLPFAELLKRAGFVVKSSAAGFDEKSFKDVRILVIADALAERNGKDEDWSLPTPSAFSDREISAVRKWVEEGGSLFLIADHMPFAGAAEKLGAELGIIFNNGFARDMKAPGEPIIFRRSDGLLKDHPITDGRNPGEKIDRVATFTGSAFKVNKNAFPLLVFDSAIVSLMPKTAWDFKFDTPRVPVGGWYQGAVFHFGKGRVAVFGDATMFTAQFRGPERTPLGMNEPFAPQNAQFLLNVVYWLSGLMSD